MKKKIISIVAASLMMGGFAAPAQATPDWVTSNHPVTAPDHEGTPLGFSNPDGFSPMGMTPSEPSGCRFIVWEVSQNSTGPWLGARAGRENCSNYATYKVMIMKEVPLRPDKVIAIAYGEGNSTAVAVGRCDGRATYYTRIESSTGNSFAGGERSKLC